MTLVDRFNKPAKYSAPLKLHYAPIGVDAYCQGRRSAPDPLSVNPYSSESLDHQRWNFGRKDGLDAKAAAAQMSKRDKLLLAMATHTNPQIFEEPRYDGFITALNKKARAACIERAEKLLQIVEAHGWRE